MKRLVERLRERLITIPKPGSKPFKPGVGGIQMTVGGGPHKPGDDAGLQTVPFTYAHPSSDWHVQEYIYAIEPLCAEAADRVAQLEAALQEIARRSCMGVPSCNTPRLTFGNELPRRPCASCIARSVLLEHRAMSRADADEVTRAALEKP